MQRIWLFDLPFVLVPCSCSQGRNPFHHNHSITSLQGRRAKVLDRLITQRYEIRDLCYHEQGISPSASPSDCGINCSKRDHSGDVPSCEHGISQSDCGTDL